MNKEELEKEAWQYADKVCGWDKTQIFDYLVEAYLASAEPREKRIAELEEKLANADYQLEGRDLEIKELEKENAELKESNKMLEQGYVWHDYDAGEDCYEDTHEGRWVKRDEVYQLTKAKELLASWISDKPYTKSELKDLIADTEQFLKDLEK